MSEKASIINTKHHYEHFLKPQSRTSNSSIHLNFKDAESQQDSNESYVYQPFAAKHTHQQPRFPRAPATKFTQSRNLASNSSEAKLEEIDSYSGKLNKELVNINSHPSTPHPRVSVKQGEVQQRNYTGFVNAINLLAMTDATAQASRNQNINGSSL